MSPNTIARWERGELPIPAWVDLLFSTQAKLSARLDEIRRLHEKVAELSAQAQTSRNVRELLEENSRLKKSEAPRAGDQGACRLRACTQR